MINLDTETVGFDGPIVTIQTGKMDSTQCNIHHVWLEKIKDTLGLIHQLVEEGVVVYNLTFDWHKIILLYNTLINCSDHNSPPTVGEVSQIYRAYTEGKATIKWCLKPAHALDLFLSCRLSKTFQGTMERKDITIKKVPASAASKIQAELNRRTNIPALFFRRRPTSERWVIQPNDDGEDWRNITLKFGASTRLKHIIDHLTTIGFCQERTNIEGANIFVNRPWEEQIVDHVNYWSTNKDAITYAIDDIRYLDILRDYLHTHEPDTIKPDKVDDKLAVCVAACRARGYTIDIDLVTNLLEQNEKEYHKLIEDGFNPNSTNSTLNYLHAVCNGLQQTAIKKTDKATLEKVRKWTDDVGQETPISSRANQIITARKTYKRCDNLRKLQAFGRFYPDFKVIGARSGRMSGGSLDRGKRSINPQGIQRDKSIRECFPLTDSGLPILCGGDFAAFEPSITDSQINSPWLRESLSSGEKIYNIVGEVIAPEAPYDRRKNAFLGYQYGAQPGKLAETYDVSLQSTVEGLKRLQEKCPELEAWRKLIGELFCSMSQPGGYGTEVQWKEPADYAETIFGFRRYFTLENRITKLLFLFAQDIPPLEDDARIIRTDARGSQTKRGACASACYAAAFNLQASNMRAAVNHYIQGIAAHICKQLQNRLWELQPEGICPYQVAPFNVHDEIECPVANESLAQRTTEIANEIAQEFKPIIPLIALDWKTHMKSWADK